MKYEFADCAIDTGTQELRVGGQIRAVEPQVLRLLLYLIDNRHRVVSRDDLVDAVWGGRIVSEAAIAGAISAARKAVGDSGARQQLIKTVARRGVRFVADLTSAAPEHAAVDAKPELHICRAADGVGITYSRVGNGKPLIKTASWINHLQHDWTSPVFGDMLHRLASRRELIWYDQRGAGLSERNVTDLSFEALAGDLYAVAEAVGDGPVSILGISQGAALAIDFASRYPDRVSRLVLWGGYARGRNRRGDHADVAFADAFAKLLREGWGTDHPAFRRMFSSLYLPEASEEQVRWWIDMQRVSTTPETAAALARTSNNIDVSAMLSRVTAPTLLVHSARDAVVPLAEAVFVAARIGDSKLSVIDSANHLVLPHEPAWETAMQEIERFLAPA
ncbi:MAG: alpha/beta hydrolase [Rhizobiaceae bacterium]|nr:alpha/beta hydrolase [Rhizobiaceae bacterium]